MFDVFGTLFIYTSSKDWGCGSCRISWICGVRLSCWMLAKVRFFASAVFRKPILPFVSWITSEVRYGF